MNENDVIRALAHRAIVQYKVILSSVGVQDGMGAGPIARGPAGTPARGMSCRDMSRVISCDDGIIVAAFLRRRGK